MAAAVHHFGLDGIEALQSPIAGADVRATQLSAGGIRGSLRIAMLGDAVLSCGKVDGDFFLEGALSPDRVVLGVLLSSTGPVSHWANEVAAGDLGFFPTGLPQTALYRGRSEYLTVALSEEQLAEFADRNEFRLSRKQLRSEGIIPVGRSVFHIGRALSHFLRHAPQRFACPAFTAEMRNQFLAAYLSRLDPDAPAPKKDAEKGRKIVSRAIEIAHAGLEKGRGIDSICTELAIPRRTLHRAFVDVTGVPPARFAQNYRLNEARRRLLHRRESVTEAATQCGFSELGKFAAYYRRLFGEPPSETLATARGAWPAAGFSDTRLS